ncbi:band 4.1-like protein 2 [Siphateles boraxobius]|uniref:band 4.1-like protein 2 n=1 Tax=Siphateles boraxobius TaxID=180520 RepID=UPI004063C9BC
MQSLFMFPFSPSSSTLSSLPPTLDTISELDILSDISEDEPDLHLEPEPEPLTWVPEGSCGVSLDGEAVSSKAVECFSGPEDPPARLGVSLLRLCEGLPEDLPLSSPSLLPSFLLIFAVFLSACQSLVLSLLLALPLAMSLCYLEPKALAHFRPAEAMAESTSSEEMQCDPAA